MLRTVFGGNFSQGAGVFDVRVSKIAKFNTIPKPADILKGLGITEEFHPQTFAYSIEQVTEYGKLEMPDYWASQDKQ